MSIAEVLSLVKEYGITMTLVLVFFFVIIVLVQPIICKEILEPVRHKRNLPLFVVPLVVGIAECFLYETSFLSKSVFVGILVILVLHVVYNIYALQHPGFYVKYILDKYETLLNDGAALENIAFFEKNHWYILRPKEKVMYALLKGRYYANLN